MPVHLSTQASNLKTRHPSKPTSRLSRPSQVGNADCESLLRRLDRIPVHLRPLWLSLPVHLRRRPAALPPPAKCTLPYQPAGSDSCGATIRGRQLRHVRFVTILTFPNHFLPPWTNFPAAVFVAAYKEQRTIHWQKLKTGLNSICSGTCEARYQEIRRRETCLTLLAMRYGQR